MYFLVIAVEPIIFGVFRKRIGEVEADELGTMVTRTISLPPMPKRAVVSKQYGAAGKRSLRKVAKRLRIPS